MAKAIRLSSLILTIAALSLTACNFPTPTAAVSTPVSPVEPTQSLEITQPAVPTSPPVVPTTLASPVTGGATNDCLTGAWEIVDFQQLVTSLLPDEIVRQGVIEFGETRGTFQYEFAQDGKVTATAGNFDVDATIDTSVLTLDLVVTLNGQATGNYAVSGETLTLSNPQNEGLTLSATVGGAPILQNTPVTSGVWFGVETGSSSQLQFQCSLDQLSLSFTPDPGSNETTTIQLQRVGQ